MAARSHVDTTISERRLRPIYDYLDNGNNKKALQEADKLIKKQKKDARDVLCAKALKALALIRLGRQDEAIAAIREVHSEGPTDDATLQAMTISYRELHKPELIADAYETATKKDPQNEELLSHLFMSYVRNADYKKQQQTAMALYKLKPKNPYYFWAIMSIVMQASNGDEKLAKTMLLPLAERMTVKFVKENKVEAEAEVQLYLMILEQQEKYEDALEVIDGPLKEKLSGYLDSLPRKRAELLSKLERWPEANAAFKKLILANPDQWPYYVEYFRSITHLVDSNWQPEENNDSPENSVDHTFDKAIDLLAALVEEQNCSPYNRVLRGPYLAQIELLCHLLKRNDPLASTLGSMVEKLFSYYEKFGSKPSCFVDISHIMSTFSLSEEEINMLLEKIKASLTQETSNENITLPKDMKQMHRHLCYSQLCHYVGHHDNWSQQQKLAYTRELVERYNHGLQFGSSLFATEFQPSDNYCLLAAHTLIDIWRKTGDERLIAQVIVLLEHGLKGSPSNFQTKLLLIKLYNVIGAVRASHTLYEDIDVKHIQQETLGYLITDPLLSSAFFSTSNIVLANSIRFYTGNYKDTVDYLISCYKFGSFTKIPEIVNFREKLNGSLQYAAVTVERMILDLLLETKSHQDTERTILCMEVDPEKDKFIEDLNDNRDFLIFRICNSKDKITVDEEIVKSFQEKVLWLKMRNLIIRVVAAAFYLTKSPPCSNNTNHNEITNGEKRVMPEILSDLVVSMKDIIDSIDKENLIQSVFPVQSAGPSRLLRYLQENYIDIFLALTELVLYLYRLVEGSADAEEKSCLKAINDVTKLFSVMIKKMEPMVSSNQDIAKPTYIKSLLEDFTNSVETLSLSTILVNICHTLLKPARISLMRKGKKKKEQLTQFTPEIFQQLSNLITVMEASGNSLHDMLNELDTSILSSRLGIMSLSDNEDCIQGKEDTVQQVTKKVESSYLISIKELKDLLQIKIKYLQSLKW